MFKRMLLGIFAITLTLSHVLEPTIEQLSECLKAYGLAVSANRAKLTKEQQAHYDRCRQLAFGSGPS